MTVYDFVSLLNENILFPLITLLTAIAALVFLFGCFKFVAGNDDESRAVGSRHILWGLIGLLVMVSAFTILTIFAKTFGLEDELRENSPDYLI